MAPERAPSTLMIGVIFFILARIRLILMHLGFGFIEEDGIILVHGESALIDPEEDENPRQNSPRDKQPDT